ncbi:MAG: type II 3-dehydroquinate dehydratase [Clostridia bacterium]|nr:type II 3-dehydroquinate dehydratase [Clostridia bacterium]
MKKVLIINGPNLNMLGIREKSIYGADTLDSINAEIKAYGSELNIECDFFQSNCEGEIITKIHSVLAEYDGCIINAGAYTHYSYAIRDAIACVNKPFIEVHMSDVMAREEFRHISVIREVCKDVIAGFGKKSYTMALKAIGELI